MLYKRRLRRHDREEQARGAPAEVTAPVGARQR
jgi:hypothetical protein